MSCERLSPPIGLRIHSVGLSGGGVDGHGGCTTSGKWDATRVKRAGAIASGETCLTWSFVVTGPESRRCDV
jgi:hypothetical protein